MNETKTPDTGMESGPVLGVTAKVFPIKDSGKMLAFASVNIGGCFAVNGIRLIDTDKGLFVAMPQQKGKDGKHHPISCPTTAEMRKALNAAVLREYEQVRDAPAKESAAVEKPSLRESLQTAAKEAAARPSAPEKAHGAEAR